MNDTTYSQLSPRGEWLLVLCLLLLVGLGATSPLSGGAEEASVELERRALTKSLKEAEKAFAASFASRDAREFRRWLHEEAVFIGGGQTFRGLEEVMRAWGPMLDPEIPAPFSWEPTVAEVNGSGDLGVTSGPVRDREGRVAGAFSSVWRRTEAGWRVIFDTSPPCPSQQ